ncbi:MAG TPA: polysaccharide deacetylase family protein [Flavisolibacter sp.]|nr:polysaccharide deacetylase family protein [Flavisolibacter sp.]
MKNQFSVVFLFVLLSCTNNQASTKVQPEKDSTKAVTTVNTNQPAASASTIISRKEVPILCYHHIKDAALIKKNSGYTVAADTFKATMKALADSGYHTVSPDQLYNYLVYGGSLPAKPVMITFDDTDEEQFTVGKTEMDKYGFKGVYYIMTISIGRPRYMTREQIKQLSDEGHTIGCHTWDHHMVTKYTGADWVNQLDKPRKKLEDIIGKKIDYFAYPFGLWNQAAIPELKQRGYKLAFQLSTKRDLQEPLYTVRRFIVAPEWSATAVLRVMRNSFK